MSGGHLDYQECYLGYIADQLDHDIEYNGVEYDDAVDKDDRKHYGYQLQPETIDFIKDVSQQLRLLQKILREYDLAISDDTCEKTFQERVGIK
jgi:hypothetical protein